MKDHPIMVFALSVILVMSIGAVPHTVFGQAIVEPVTVATDMEMYSAGDLVRVTGMVGIAHSGMHVSIIITSPNGNIASIGQVPVEPDNMYDAEFVVGGTMWKLSGTYMVKATYNENDVTTSFEVDATGIGQTDPNTPDPSQPVEYKNDLLEPSDAPVTYTIMGGSLISIEPDVENKSLIIMIDATDDGSLIITIPRTILESIDADGEDVDVFILVDDEEANDVDMTATPTDRTFTIPFSVGNEKIEIIGTWVIPEFGVIAVMILAVAIISIIVVSTRSRFSIIMPRY